MTFELPSLPYASDALDVETIRDVLGIMKGNVFLNIIQSIEKKNHKEVIHQLSQLIDSGFAISDFINGFNSPSNTASGFVDSRFVLKSFTIL